MDKDWKPGERKAETPEKKPAYRPVEEWNEQPRRSLPSWWWMPLAALVIIIVAISFLKNDPQLQCGSEDLQRTAEELSLQARLSSCEEALAAKQTPAADCSDTAFNVLRRDLAQCRTDLDLTDEKIDEREETLEEQEAVIADAARRICCAQRVENSAINTYDIDNNKIVCTTNNGVPLSC